jgi:hypothetical protein
MKLRSTRMVVAVVALLGFLIAFGGSGIAAKPGKSGLKAGVNKVKGGTTTLTIDPGYATAVIAAGITPAAVAPATAPVAGTYVFPITGGRLVFHKTKKAGSKSKSKKQISGFVTHSGGISLTKDTTSTTLSDLRANLSANRTGRVDAKLGADTLKLAKLSNVTIDAQNKTVSAKVTLTGQAVAAINSAFGTAFPSGIVLGTIVIAPTF